MELVSCPEEYLELHTANGPTVVNREVPVRVKHLNEVARALVLDSTPPVLSVGLRCVDHGYSFYWGPGSLHPLLTAPSGKKVVCHVRNYVPYLDTRLPAAPVALYGEDGESDHDGEEADMGFVGPGPGKILVCPVSELDDMDDEVQARPNPGLRAGVRNL